MRTAVWFSQYGLPDVEYFLPYKARSPVLLRVLTYQNKGDLFDEIDRLLKDKGTHKFGVGQSLFYQLPLFCNPSVLIPNWCWEMINDYQSVKKFHIPIAKSLDSANAWQLDCFNIIDQEITRIKNHERIKNG
ncbi:MAG: hypothetical protein Tp1102DCM295711_38 [Prokaryotic dsDNA virus sp.]|nr:MAG: hypothetical protein Tp1102DCM295711_38 [Prokaryotic dsDNA virus sp.]